MALRLAAPALLLSILLAADIALAGGGGGGGAGPNGKQNVSVPAVGPAVLAVAQLGLCAAYAIVRWWRRGR